MGGRSDPRLVISAAGSPPARCCRRPARRLEGRGGLQLRLRQAQDDATRDALLGAQGRHRARGGGRAGRGGRRRRIEVEALERHRHHLLADAEKAADADGDGHRAAARPVEKDVVDVADDLVVGAHHRGADELRGRHLLAGESGRKGGGDFLGGEREGRSRRRPPGRRPCGSRIFMPLRRGNGPERWRPAGARAG